MINSCMKMQQPVSIDELYKKARYMLLYCHTGYHLIPYGNLRNPRKHYAIKDWGSFVIIDTTIEVHSVYSAYDRIEIPKYAPFNHS